MSEFQNLFEQPISKINVIGTSGTGKSTFAKKLSSVLGIPYIEMDKIFWGPNWNWPIDEEFFAKLQNSLDRPDWILDGNYTRTIPIKWKNVDLVIWLDYPFALTLFQAVRRAIGRAWTKEEIWGGTGNRESFRKSFFTKDSIIWWMVKTHGKVRKKHQNYFSDTKYQHIKFVRLRSHAEAAEFVEAWKNNHENNSENNHEKIC